MVRFERNFEEMRQNRHPLYYCGHTMIIANEVRKAKLGIYQQQARVE